MNKQDVQEGQKDKVVRDRVYGSSKFHLPAIVDNGMCAITLCGLEATCGTFPLSGNRADFERVSPNRICKRCRLREAKTDESVEWAAHPWEQT